MRIPSLTRGPRDNSVLLTLLFAALPACVSGGARPALAQNPTLEKRGAQHQNTAEVLSAAKLSPALHGGNRRVVFSPDGKYLLAQDDSGVSLFTRKPLAERFRITTDDALPAAFTADSQNIVLATHSLEYEIASVMGTGKGEQRQFSPSMQSCVFTQLSAAGNVFDCLNDDGSVHFFDVASGKETCSAKAFNFGVSYLGFDALSEPSAFSEPFGIVEEYSRHAEAAGKKIERLMKLSPDGHYALWASLQNTVEGFDIAAQKKINVPGALKYKPIGTLGFVAPDQILVMDWQKTNGSELIEFSSGKTLGKPKLAGTFLPTSSAQYVILRPPEGDESSVVDLTAGKIVAEKVDFGSDVRDGEVASYSGEGLLVIQPLGETNTETIGVTAGWMSVLKAAIASANLSAFVVGTGGGAVYSPATGARIAAFDNATGVWCGASGDCYVSVAAKKSGGFQVEKVDAASGKTTVAWTHPASSEGPKSKQASGIMDEFEPSGGVILDYSINLNDEMRMGAAMMLRGYLHPAASPDTVTIPAYQLRALDIQTGNELWTRKFASEPPVPFSDPQGDRIVLGWSASSDGGKKAAKDNAVAAKALKADKKTTHDIYFEILEARTGKTVGGVLVPSNAPADTFDEAFSEGDWLVLARDGQRVMVESLSTGEEILRLHGWRPSIHPGSALLTLSAEETELDLYDLKAREKLKDYRFPGPVMYTDFSADGMRILAVTREQLAFVLDVSGVRGEGMPKAQ